MATHSYSSKVQVLNLGLYEQSADSRTVWVRWNWPGGAPTKYIDHYKVVWTYSTPSTTGGGDFWHTGEKETQEVAPLNEAMEANYSPPNNDANAVKVTITPVSKTYEEGKGNKKKDVPYFEGSGYTSKGESYYFKNNPPGIPEGLTVTIESASTNVISGLLSGNTSKKPQLIAKLTGNDINAVGVEFEVRKCNENNTAKPYDLGSTNPQDAFSSTGDIDWKCNVEFGEVYQVRCRGYRNEGASTNLKTVYGEYCEWSEKVYAPVTAPKLTSVIVTSKESAQITWDAVNSAKEYTIQYVARNPKYDIPREQYFDIIGLQIESVTINVKEQGIDTSQPIIRYLTELATGATYYVRLGSSNSSSSATQWSAVSEFTIGMTPEIPTIWASNKKLAVGETLNLYWAHNSKDSSLQKDAEVEFSIGSYGYSAETENMEFVAASTYIYNYSDAEFAPGIISGGYKNDPDELADQVYKWVIDTNHSALQNGSAIRWRMRTSGISDTYSDWSEYNIVNIYVKPSFISTLYDINGNIIQNSGNITSYPLYLELATSEHTNQKPTSYHIQIKPVLANNQVSYESVNDYGEIINIGVDTALYSKHIDSDQSDVALAISANDATLENGGTYKITCSVFMSSGITVVDEHEYNVYWSEDSVIPFAMIRIDEENLTASIRPYTRDQEADVSITVFRKEYDGTFTEIASDVKNGQWVTDKYPSLDYARYRIVARSNENGVIRYADISEEIGEKALVIQWNEAWKYLYEETEWSAPVYNKVGSMLKLPYNIATSHSNSRDISLIKYIGRKSPVSYYGTQIGEKASWSTVIDKTDKETLYALRRLSVWMGDVYVREPSGTGYWASVEVNYSVNPLELTIPVSISVTRVEGGK